MKLLEKINILNIIKKHFGTLHNDNSKKMDFDDVFTFLILPVSVAVLLMYLKVDLSSDAVNVIISTLAILVGLFFNVIVIIFDIVKRDNSQTIKNRILRELLTNISFSIVLSLFIILMTLITKFNNQDVRKVFIFIVYLLATKYLITVLMILKRMYCVFLNEIDEIEKKAN